MKLGGVLIVHWGLGANDGAEFVVSSRRIRAAMLATLLICAGLLALAFVGLANAATFNVTGTGDGTGSCDGVGNCTTLRAAVLASNSSGPGPNTINLQANTYNLTTAIGGPDDGTTGDLEIATSVAVNGVGAGSTTINDSSGVTNDRVFDIGAGAASVTLSGMTITGAAGAQTSGGAIEDSGGSLTLVGVSLSGNTAKSPGSGGAVLMEPTGSGTLTITGSTFTSNTAALSGANGGGAGGAIQFEPGTTGTMSITNSTFDSNTAQSGSNTGGGFGGAVRFEPGTTGTLTISGSTFTSNTAAGSSTQNGFGGALMFEPGMDPSSLSITNSTFTGNAAGGASQPGFGGAIMFQPGGVPSTSTGTLAQVTIVGNSAGGASDGGGIDVWDGPVTVSNSIVSGNTSGGVTNNCTTLNSGSLAKAGHNIENGGSCGFDLNADPLVAALANNGGPTKTMALSASSPAIDAGAPAFCPAADQRGVTRPDNGEAACDLGAYEFQDSTQSPPQSPHNTTIAKAKINKKRHTASFTFNAAGATGFQCALIRPRQKGKHHKKPKATFSPCSSPKTYKHLKSGRYTFEVLGVNSAGPDPHPAIKKFRI